MKKYRVIKNLYRRHHQPDNYYYGGTTAYVKIGEICEFIENDGDKVIICNTSAGQWKFHPSEIGPLCGNDFEL